MASPCSSLQCLYPHHHEEVLVSHSLPAMWFLQGTTWPICPSAGLGIRDPGSDVKHPACCVI